MESLGKGYRHQGAQITIYQHHTPAAPDQIQVFCQEKELKIKALKQEPKGPLMGDRKEIDRFFDQEILPKQEDAVLPTGPTAQGSPMLFEERSQGYGLVDNTQTGHFQIARSGHF